jgi:hypothetical protein
MELMIVVSLHFLVAEGMMEVRRLFMSKELEGLGGLLR